MAAGNEKPLLRKLAEEILGAGDASRIWKRIDIIGDIAVIKKPFDFPLEKLKPLANALVEKIPYIKSVWVATSPVEGQYRLRDLVHLAGEKKTETIYREHGCAYKLDITKVYISLRLSYEHKRIASMVKDGERILNMYAGAGFFSILSACMHDIEVAYSIDINPYAYSYMVINTRLNHVEDKVMPILGDAYTTVMKLLKSSADRVLMPLPEKALEHLPAAVAALDREGWIHVYLHVAARTARDAIALATKMVRARLVELAASYVVENARVVRSVGPREYQVVVDTRVKR
ncbi:protein of unknown function Met10 [Pyrolobus fumarii 1A]|uniref:SAM-dependent methyltransferase TRM5/TYW2-type domain-containing protein n=1 Tax=Pyrolobus fumarii (strain DSM 11204 / 1A) TaxID=694429 RepID=G0EEH1_PYRF1|nr:class I SAM-dependent methyltransferase family protein [Pyrolobus fumarii]AEM38012.1 protein of unknown function Met10 [Pyrolobus fumarii 1A]